MKSKNTIIFLIVGSAFWTLSDFYYLIKRFTSGMSYYRDNILDLFISSLQIVIPISFLVFAISLLNNKQVTNTVSTSEFQEIKNFDNMSIGNWIGAFLITLIPLGGLVALILWANDSNNKVRKNWAIASLIYQGIILVLVLFIYVFILLSYKKSYSNFNF